MKKFLVILTLFATAGLFAQPANDDCSSATVLTVDSPTTCGENSTGGSLEGGECFVNYGGGSTEYTSWYRFTANNDSMVINWIYTNSVNCFPHIQVYGPFASGAGCLPGCGSSIFSQLSNGDPGYHPLLTGLTIGSDYLIQIQTDDCGGPGDGNLEYCIGVFQPSTNGMSTGASLIDECGTAFSQTTDGGYWQSGTGTGFANLDANAGTTCGGCLAGNDVSFVINNAAWYKFCSLVAGTWQITVDNVSNCALTGAGVQAAVFTGDETALVNEGESSPVPAGGWTSPIITVNAGECAWLMIDGFAGDMCDFDVTLTHVSGAGCTILSLDLLSFSAIRTETSNILSWVVGAESNNDRFIIKRSYDGENFVEIGEVMSIGDHFSDYEYTFEDAKRENRENIYYSLVLVDKDGKEEVLAMKLLKTKDSDGATLSLYPNPTENSVNLEFNSSRPNSTATIVVYDIMGVEVYKTVVNTEKGFNSTQVYMDELKSGNYVLKVISEDKVLSAAFSKR